MNELSDASKLDLPSATLPATPMRVAYILHRFPCISETFIANEIYWLQEQDVEVSIFSLMSPKDGPVHDVAKKLLPLTHYTPWMSWAILWSQIYFLLRLPIRYLSAFVTVIRQTFREPKLALLAVALFPKNVHLAREMKRLKIDHIHAHFVWLGGISASVVRELVGISFSLHPHAFGLFQRNQKDAKYELELADFICTIATYHRRKIVELCPKVNVENVHIVNLGIDTERMIPRCEARAIGDQPLRILTVGRPIEKKGHEYLIEACSHLVSRGIPFQCEMMVGRGKEAESLQEVVDRFELQDRVKLIDFRDQQEVLKEYHKSDIFALACVMAKDGDRDGMPVVLIEAMACGLPVVTCPVSGIPDLVRDGENGLLVKSRDAVSFADALERLIGDANLREQLGDAARETIVDEFDIRKTTTRLASVFRQYSQPTQQSVPKQTAAEPVRI
ncbi:GDP-mannose-dependent alpha-(1-6)-phosphatidylinositol monomannoside mannosyltransferase [Novipirellula aureliae]|uniref:GDP-mannose-dependent alpha-(1-6)-phosphatidylinositol monomannoside mannosyltransferase n=1 Tax=Novipirellula aureliae TaxID=2527966 RepID=A0A5C6DLS4_9BACT|nr:glycosyltransferase [Novipirellula aureliae]TWU35819.1 GDP-mannose-dependent alpha-(1-6)-phosphatidylinositol monomannoside mannosyltransferase [Novipirellula aureliae]